MYEPQFDISPEILKSIGQVEAAKAIIENSPLIPLYERQFKAEATARKVHFSTAIEGNYLKLDEVKRLVGVDAEIDRMTDDEGNEVIARKRDIREVINYRDAVKYMEEIEKSITGGLDSDTIGDISRIFDAETPQEPGPQGVQFILTEDHIKHIHQILLKGILDNSAGKYRRANAATINYATGEKLFPYEDAASVSTKMKDLVAWYNGRETYDHVHPVIRAGLLHLEFVRIHPFEEGNGRMARALATLSLTVDGYDVGHFFCLDEYYDSNAEDYYRYLGEGFKHPTIWLEYFALGMAIEFNRIKERVQRISKDAKVKERTGQMYITERQEKIIEWLNTYGHFRNQDFTTLFPSVSDDTVLRELKGLIDNDIIVKKGKTKAARYELS